MSTTKKKVKALGCEKFINASTGEIETVEYVTVEERDFNFTKVWLTHFLASIDLLGTQKLHFATWLVGQCDRANLIAMSYRAMADLSGVSLSTVQTTMKVLMDADFIRMVNRGVYRINPNVLFRGDHKQRMVIMAKYQSEEYKPLSNEEKLANLLESKEELEIKIAKIERRLQIESLQAEATQSEQEVA